MDWVGLRSGSVARRNARAGEKEHENTIGNNYAACVVNCERFDSFVKSSTSCSPSKWPTATESSGGRCRVLSRPARTRSKQAPPPPPVPLLLPPPLITKGVGGGSDDVIQGRMPMAPPRRFDMQMRRLIIIAQAYCYLPTDTVSGMGLFVNVRVGPH